MDTQPTQNQEDSPISELNLLAELVKLQKEHNQQMAEFSRLIGWIYAYLITAIIVGILVIFFVISGGRL
jgi:hypothetical protein